MMCEVLAWAASGAMGLTGHPGQAPDASPAAAFGLLARVCDLLEKTTGVRPDPGTILTTRARLRGLNRAGRVSANGTTRLLRTADGWCAVTLSRPDDVAAVPAILGSITNPNHLGSTATPDTPWSALESAARTMTATALADRAQLLSVPAAPLPAATAAPATPTADPHTPDPATPATPAADPAAVDVTSTGIEPGL
ncbi:MAG: hypothetical protein ABSA93_20910 [Streptosporangiaceae bacterium]